MWRMLQVHAPACSLDGPGLSAVHLGRDMAIMVRLADGFGNAITHAGRLEAIGLEVRTPPFCIPLS